MTIGIADEFTSFDQRAVIKVCGIGGGGGNAVGRMIEAGLKDVDFITINTDAQALKHSPAGTRLQIGIEVTGGLGSGARPDVGQKAAIEDRERIQEVLRGADMVFLTAGLGGGTGTGASPIVAEMARATGALTLGIVTVPFSFEGKERMSNALEGLVALEQHVDTLIVVPNDRVAQLCSQTNTSLLNAFQQADEVLHNGVRAISELITVPGLINLDFADVRTIMQARGRALMGIGIAEGEHRARRAAEEAIVCPLLEQSNIDGAKGVIVNIRGGCDIGMREIQEAVTTVQKSAHRDANIIFGAVVDDEERPTVQVTVIAAGFPKEKVSVSFLGAGAAAAAPAAAAPRPAQPARPGQPSGPAQPGRPMPAAHPAEAARPAQASRPAPAAAPAAKPAPAPQVQYLFPEDEQALSRPGAPAAPGDPDEDLGIPAFMRKRKKVE